MTCMLVNNADGKVILRGDRDNLLKKAKTLCESQPASYTVYEEVLTVASKLAVSVYTSEKTGE